MALSFLLMTVLGSSAGVLKRKNLSVGIVAGLAAGALWGMVFVVPRMTPGLSSVDLTAARFVSFGAIAAVAMLLTWRSHTLSLIHL